MPFLGTVKQAPTLLQYDVTGALKASNNLSDIPTPATALTNIGAAALAGATFTGAVTLNGSAALTAQNGVAVSGAALTAANGVTVSGGAVSLSAATSIAFGTIVPTLNTFNVVNTNDIANETSRAKAAEVTAFAVGIAFSE